MHIHSPMHLPRRYNIWPLLNPPSSTPNRSSAIYIHEQKCTSLLHSFPHLLLRRICMLLSKKEREKNLHVQDASYPLYTMSRIVAVKTLQKSLVYNCFLCCDWVYAKELNSLYVSLSDCLFDTCDELS